MSVAALGLCTGCAALPSAAPAATPPTSAQAGATTVVAVASPAPATMTLPEFLGIKALARGIGGIGQRVRNRLGSRFPGLEAKPPLLAITDPANTGPNASPAVKAAAEAKAEEDMAPQKAKAIRYLASLGCGKCYPDTEDALLAALDDCNELIRLETVKGLRTSMGADCQSCRQNSCCSPKLVNRLNEIAYATNDVGCFVEPSASVRRNARLAVAGCGCVPGEATQAAPTEGPSGEGPPGEGPTKAEQLPNPPVAALETQPGQFGDSKLGAVPPGSSSLVTRESPMVLASDNNVTHGK